MITEFRLKKNLLQLCLKYKYHNLLEFFCSEAKYFEVDSFVFQSIANSRHNLQWICQSGSAKLVNNFFENHLKHVFEPIKHSDISENFRKDLDFTEHVFQELEKNLFYSIFDVILECLLQWEDKEIREALKENFISQWKKIDYETRVNCLLSLSTLPSYSVKIANIKGGAVVPMFVKLLVLGDQDLI